jgi:hypothetical protein
MIKHRHQRFNYTVLREVIQGVQQNMMIVLLMKADSGTFENGQHHELYVGNKLLVYSVLHTRLDLVILTNPTPS